MIAPTICKLRKTVFLSRRAIAQCSRPFSTSYSQQRKKRDEDKSWQQQRKKRDEDKSWQEGLDPRDWKQSQYGAVKFDVHMYDLPPGEDPGFGHTPDPVKCYLYQLHTEDPEYWTYARLSKKFGVSKERVAASIILKQNEKDNFSAPDPELVALSNYADAEYARQLGEAAKHFGRELARPATQALEAAAAGCRRPPGLPEEGGGGRGAAAAAVEVPAEGLEAELARRGRPPLGDAEREEVAKLVQDVKSRGSTAIFEVTKEGYTPPPPSATGMAAFRAHFEAMGFEPTEEGLARIERELAALGTGAAVEFQVQSLLIKDESDVKQTSSGLRASEYRMKALDDTFFLKKKARKTEGEGASPTEGGGSTPPPPAVAAPPAPTAAAATAAAAPAATNRPPRRSTFVFRDTSRRPADAPTEPLSGGGGGAAAAAADPLTGRTLEEVAAQYREALKKWQMRQPKLEK